AVLVLLLALAVVGGVGYAVVSQLHSLALDLPKHSEEIAQKLSQIREAVKGSWLDRLGDASREVESLLRGETAEDASRAIRVRIESPSFPFLQSVAGPVVESLISTMLVVVLVAFMLVKHEDLRNRVIRLSGGDGNLTEMTKALDDATTRISRFLLMQLGVNASFGIALVFGLTLIGVPYAALWGFLGACLRYVPYVGAWLACAFPLLLSVAVLPGFASPLLVFGLFLVLELVISNLVEPWLYGQSINVSEVALLVAAAFWTWLWGPMGLVLSTPLTACFAVLGRYVPNLEFLHVLLGDAPVLEPFAVYYQRLLARDQDEAAYIVEEFVLERDWKEAFDSIFVPALSLARRNQRLGKLSAEDLEFIARATVEVLETSSLSQGILKVDGEGEPASAAPVTVFGCPASDELDELTLKMLKRLVDPTRCRFEVLSPDALTAEVLAEVGTQDAPAVCIGALPPQNLARARYLCKRLRGRFPTLKILVGCWGWAGERSRIEDRLLDAGANQIATSLCEARSQLVPLVQVLQHADEKVA
ncbi:MAG TPA: AI-2E family transporter, partial [Gemmataceae bacterium]|nr:AI-2E family transporter [Gemmataceae bacterium]